MGLTNASTSRICASSVACGETSCPWTSARLARSVCRSRHRYAEFSSALASVSRVCCYDGWGAYVGANHLCRQTLHQRPESKAAADAPRRPLFASAVEQPSEPPAAWEHSRSQGSWGDRLEPNDFNQDYAYDDPPPDSRCRCCPSRQSKCQGYQKQWGPRCFVRQPQPGCRSISAACRSAVCQPERRPPAVRCSWW